LNHRPARRHLGFDGAFGQHDGPLAEQPARIAPGGIDVGSENIVDAFHRALAPRRHRQDDRAGR
jgi:hypothetical protein